MTKRDRLELLLRQITDNQFNGIWKNTYGYIPCGKRLALVRDFVAEQYDSELDGSIALAESLLKTSQKAKTP